LSPKESGFFEKRPDPARNFFRRPGAVKDANAEFFAGGEFEIPAPHRFEKLFRLTFNPVRILVPVPQSGERCGTVEVEEERHVGNTITDGESIDAGSRFRRNLPGHSLINGRRIKKSVGNHGAPRRQCRKDHFPDKLGAAGCEKQELGLRGEGGALGRVLEKMPDHLAGGRSPGLTHQQRIHSAGMQCFRKNPDLGGFSTAFRAFECQKKSFAGRACFHLANIHTGLQLMPMESRKICFVATEPEEEEFFTGKFGTFDISFQRSLCDVPEDVEVVSIFINDRVDARFLESHPTLRLIATRSVGCDHIDLEACTERKVSVTHVSGYGENTVAEHTFALMLALSRRIRESTEAALAGKFTHERFRGMDLRGSTLGVVGAGRVGLHVIRIAGAFGMNVLAYDAHPNPLHTELLDFKYTSFDHLIRESHVITLHIPLNEETHHIFNRETLSRCREGVLIVNTARGRLVDSEALIEALDSGQVGGAGLDVIEEEGVFQGGATALLGAQIADRVRGSGVEKDRIALSAGRMKEISRYIASNALLRRPQVVFTPHNAYNSTESREFISNTTSENILNYFEQNS